MCGIVGKISWERTPKREVVEAMTREMALRGPDAEGFYFDEHAGLGHRRLAILDLSDAGRQPMVDSSGRYQIVFNGEIYNYQPLRAELERSGAQFRSQTDTEVILESYKRFGISCVERFNGMFAFALWDRAERKLFLARDRLGKKPLFYTLLPDGGIAFSSEQKALLRDPEVPRGIDPRGLAQYLLYGYTLSDGSFLSAVKKLPPAHVAILERGKPLQLSRYWDLAAAFRNKSTMTEAEAAEQIVSLLDDATRLRLISDVPLGAFLSGGIDSSSIVAAMCALRPPEKVSTFSIGFHEPTYSELSEARVAAGLLRVDHRERFVDAKMANELDKIVRAADEPFADNSMVPTYFLTRFARERVTVSLSGDGGDEIFAGYETYSADRLHRLMSRLPSFSGRLFQSAVDNFLPVSFDKVSFDYKLRKFLSAQQLSFPEAHVSWRTYFAEDELETLLRPSAMASVQETRPSELFYSFFAEVPELHYLDRAMYVDIKTWLPDDILVKADRMSMANSLELRCPLLDYRLVELAASLPPSMKMRGGTKKFILKRSQEQRLSKEILYRKKKGFNAPVAHWLTSELEPQLTRLTKGDGVLSSLIRPERVAALVEEHRARKSDNGFKLFNLLVLASWMEQSGISELA